MPLPPSPFPSAIAFQAESAPPEGADEAALWPEERALLSEKVAGSRLHSFSLGRHAARGVLKQLGQPAGPILRQGPRMPLWPKGVVGSIAHTEELALAAAAPQKHFLGLGVDLERVERMKPTIAPRICRPPEIAHIFEDHSPDSMSEHQQLACAIIFACKESIYKALNPATGVYFGFQDAELAPFEGQAHGSLSWSLKKTLSPAFPAGFTGEGAYTLHGPWVIAGVWVKA